ncbi:hypothetical protein [Bacillus phage SRT01hs]|uniref:Uncharacterized protein n=1 Tax=Bacillus phage SRT01hs TaxID=2847044 RepID=A0A6B9T0V8_9CAUD|nr:hypothetical protein H3022_gp31 [Bacillus phage SRT01hs]QHJ75883.1 hypothetical protein [Bacillus phage SRT01hs]
MELPREVADLDTHIKYKMLVDVEMIPEIIHKEISSLIYFDTKHLSYFDAKSYQERLDGVFVRMNRLYDLAYESGAMRNNIIQIICEAVVAHEHARISNSIEEFLENQK